MLTIRFATIAVVAALGACGGDDDGDDTDAASGAPSVAMTCSPASGGEGDDVTVTLDVENFDLVAPTDPPSANVDGEGHYHIYLDDNTGLDYLVADIATDVDVTIGAEADGWTAGDHTLKVVFQNNDHSLVEPGVSETCDVVVN